MLTLLFDTHVQFWLRLKTKDIKTTNYYMSQFSILYIDDTIEKFETLE